MSNHAPREFSKAVPPALIKAETSFSKGALQFVDNRDYTKKIAQLKQAANERFKIDQFEVNNGNFLSRTIQSQLIDKDNDNEAQSSDDTIQRRVSMKDSYGARRTTGNELELRTEVEQTIATNDLYDLQMTYRELNESINNRTQNLKQGKGYDEHLARVKLETELRKAIGNAIKVHPEEIARKRAEANALAKARRKDKKKRVKKSANRFELLRSESDSDDDPGPSAPPPQPTSPQVRPRKRKPKRKPSKPIPQVSNAQTNESDTEKEQQSPSFFGTLFQVAEEFFNAIHPPPYD